LSQFLIGLALFKTILYKILIEDGVLMQRTENMVNETMLKKLFLTIGLGFLSFVFISLPAEAHHPWESQKESFNIIQGFFSGLAHPLLGMDHLIFLISVGLVGRLSSFTRVPFLLICGTVGSIASQFFPIFPGAELLMGISIICSALVAFCKLPTVLMPGLILAHGFVLGNSMIGIEPTPLSAYFVGLLVIELLMIFLGRFLLERFYQYRKVILSILLGAGLTITTSSVL